MPGVLTSNNVHGVVCCYPSNVAEGEEGRLPMLPSSVASVAAVYLQHGAAMAL